MKKYPTVIDSKVKFGKHEWLDCIHKTKEFIKEYTEDDIEQIIAIEMTIDRDLENILNSINLKKNKGILGGKNEHKKYR